MKILSKIVAIILLCIIIISTISMSVYAETAMNASSMVSSARGFIDKGRDEADGVEIGDSLGQLSSFGSVLTTIGVAILVMVTIVMGIRYITATPEAQGKLKQQLIGLVVAAFVIFGSYSIWKIVVSIVKNL